MQVKITVVGKANEENQVPPYATVEISGNEAIVRDLLQKIEQDAAEYRFE